VHDASAILRDLFLVFLLARVGGEILTRWRQPAVIGELLVGVLVGPHVLGWVRPGDVLEAVAEMGVVFLLFEVGLHNRFSDLRRVGGTATGVAVSGVVVPFLLGAGALLAFGRSRHEAVFLGAALVATSVGVTARVFRDLGALRGRESRIVLAAAVIDDVLGLLVLAVVSGLATGGLSGGRLLLLGAEAAFFLVFVTTVGTRLMRRHGPLLGRLRVSDGPFVFGVVLCLGLSALAASVGLAAIVGAFLAGMVFAEAREQHAIEVRIDPVTNFLTPYFFVLTGMAVDPRLLGRGAVLWLAVVVLALAVVGKVVPCALAAGRLGRRSALVVGLGMVPRAEVGIIVADMGLRSGLMGADVYGVIVLMSVATTLIAPVALRAALRRGPDAADVGGTDPVLEAAGEDLVAETRP
jgi:Kef-type K+ transport system membrane component KefB